MKHAVDLHVHTASHRELEEARRRRRRRRRRY